MKRAWSFVVVVLASLSLAGADEPAKATLKLEGMTCGGCVAAVKFQLFRVDELFAPEILAKTTQKYREVLDLLTADK